MALTIEANYSKKVGLPGYSSHQFSLSLKAEITDLTALVGVTQVRELSLSGLDLPNARLPQLRAFAQLKTLTLVRYGKGYPDETQTKVKALLPKVDVKFVQ
jgi:hypothetical protein